MSHAKRLRQAAAVLLMLAILPAALCACGKETAEEQGEAEILIRQIVGTYRDTLKPEAVEEALEKLEEVSPSSGKQWRRILEFWDTVNDPAYINTAAVPENLPNDRTLCFVVLGYSLNYDGSMREELLQRLNAALACARKYPYAYILCTGGGTADGAPDATEAGVMVQWLESQGVESERLIAETASLTTTQNAANSIALLESRYSNIRELVIVTSDYHVPWGGILFEAACLLNPRIDGAVSVVGNYAAATATTYAGQMPGIQAAGLLDLLEQYR